MKHTWIIIIAAVILLLTLRGHVGIPTAQNLNTSYWTDNGPFELSPERGRFALTFSLLENKSFFYTLPVAQFAIPDLGLIHGHYVSLFAPGVSYIIMPGYIIGKALGSSQLGAFAVISLFAVLNVLLIDRIAQRLGIRPAAASLGALTFLFATPAYNYAITLYQHHISTFLILLSIYLLLISKKIWSLAVIWFLCALSIPIDYPNLFLMIPIGSMAVLSAIRIRETITRYRINIQISKLFAIGAIAVPLAFFLWFNMQSYQNPLQFSGTITNVKDIQTHTLEQSFNPPERSALNFFNSRNLVNGLYLQFISPDRGILYFTPIMFLSLFGAWALHRKNHDMGVVIISIMVITILLYALWGDPWGGWAFGSRYLIPMYAMGGICLAAALDYWRKNYIFLFIFFILFVYSTAVNTAGALTSSANPPQVEVLNLEKVSGIQQRYSFNRNIYELQQKESKSFFYETFLQHHISAFQYYIYLTCAIIIFGAYPFTTLLKRDYENV